MTVSILRPRRHLRLLMPLLALLTALALPSSRGALADPVLPPKTARVVDAAEILRSNQEQSLNAQLNALKQRSGVELVVVTLPSLQNYSIEQWGRALGEGWYVGGKNGLGALLIVAPNDRQVRIEVGDALSGLITDREASAIIETRIIPQFRAGEMSGGVLAGIDAMIQEAMPPTAPSPQPNKLKSSPAGASWDSSVRSFLSRIDWQQFFTPSLGVIILLLMFWLLRRLGRQLDTVQSANQKPAGTDQSPGWLEWLKVDDDNSWLLRRSDRGYGSSNSSWSFGSSRGGSSPSFSSGSSRSSWSGSGSSGSWGSSRSSSSSSHSSSSSSSGRSSGGFSGRGASGRW